MFLTTPPLPRHGSGRERVAQQAQQVDLDQNGPVEVGKAHGAGAHNCGFEEVVPAVLSTRSVAASSTSWPGRCSLNDVEILVLRLMII